MKRTTTILTLAMLVLALASCAAPFAFKPQEEDPVAYNRKHYTKQEVRIPMRDGVLLHTAIYAPNDQSPTHPIIMQRTPYRSKPYGEDEYPAVLGPDPLFAKEGYIFVYQDIRGRYMSEGQVAMMTPHKPDKQPGEVDESTDAYDTIEWLLAIVPNHNGKVGMWGVSWPGFLAAASMIDHHPALVAVSPQSPMTDLYFDDYFHNGATFLSSTYCISRLFWDDHSAPPSDEKSFFPDS